MSPEHPFPSPHQVRKRLQADGVALAERLCVYGQHIDAEWLDQGVLDVVKARYWSFIPRRGSGRVELAAAAAPRPRGGRDRQGPRRPRAVGRRAHRAVRETRPEAIADLRVAADELRRHSGGDGHLRRQPQPQRLQRLHRRLRVLRLAPGRRPTSTTATSSSRASRTPWPSGRRRSCGHSASRPDWSAGHRGSSRRRGEWEPTCTCSAMEIAHMCDISGLPPAEVFARFRDALDSTPGTAARGPARRRPRAHQPQQADRRPLGRSSRPAIAPACARRAR